MVYEEIRIVWQTAKRIRAGRNRLRNMEFLEFLAHEGETYRMRQAALHQLLDLTRETPAASPSAKTGE